MLVNAYIALVGLILEPFEVDAKTNEIKALPILIEKLALQGVIFVFDAINNKNNLPVNFDSGNDYIAALKGNQLSLLKDVKKTLHRNLLTNR